MKGKSIRTLRTNRVLKVLEQRGHKDTDDFRLLVELVSSPHQEDQGMLGQSFWLEHSEWEEIDPSVHAAEQLSPSALSEAAQEAIALGTCDEDS